MPTSPAIVVIRRAVISSNVSPPARRSWARRRSKASFFSSSRCDPPGRRRALAVADEQHQLAVGHARSSRSTSAVPTNPVDPVMAIRCAGQRLGDHGPMSSSTSLPIGREHVRGTPRRHRSVADDLSGARVARTADVGSGRHGPAGQDRRRHRRRRRDRRRARARRSSPPAPTPSSPPTVRADAIARRRRSVVAEALDVGDEAATIALVARGRGRPRADRPVVRQRRRRPRRRRRRARRRVGAAVERQRDGPRLRGSGPAAGLDRPRRGPPRDDGVDGRHPHVARRRRLRGHQARRPRVRRVAGDHPRRAGRQGVVRVPGRRRHADADRLHRRRRGQGVGDHRRRRRAVDRTRPRPASSPPSRDDVFFIYTHPELKLYVERKAADPDRWIRGMARLWGRSQHLLAD